MFYLGYNANNGHIYDKNIIKLQSGQTTHCYIMNHNIFQYVLDNIEKNWNSISEYSDISYKESLVNWKPRAIDLFYSKWIHHRRNNTFALYPLICSQRTDYSDIEGRTIEYNSIFNKITSLRLFFL